MLNESACIYIYIYIYEGCLECFGLKSAYYGVMSAADDFFFLPKG